MALNNKNKKDVFELRKKHIYNSKLSSFEKKELFVYLNSLYRSNNITTSEMNNKFNEKFNERLKNKNREDNARKVVYENSELLIKNSNLIKEDKRKLLIFLNSLNDSNLVNFVEMENKFQEEYDNTLKKQEIINQKKQEIYNQETQKIINLNIPKEKKEKLLNYLESLNKNINITPEEMKQKSEKIIKKQEIYNQEKQKIINLNIPKEKKEKLLNYLESLNQNINITPEEMKQKSEKEYKKALEKQKIFTQIKQKIINLNIPKEIEKILLNYLESLNKNINITPEEMKQKSEKIIKKQEIYNKETQKIINLNIPKEIEKILLNYLESLNKNINITPEEMKQKSEKIIKKQEIYNKETQKIINLNIPKEIEKILLNYLESLNKNINITPEEMKQKSEKIIIKQEIYNKETQKIINLNILQEDKNELLNQLNVLNENENISSHAMEKKINDEIDTVIELKGLQPTFNIIVEHEKEQINNSNLPNEKKKELMNFLKILSNSKIFSNNEIEYKFEKKFNSYIKENDLICKKNDSIKLKKSQIITSELPNDVKNILFNYLGDLSKIEPFNIDDFNNKFDLKFQTLNYENRINLQNHIINVKKIQIKKSKLPSDKKEELYKYINSITKNEIFDIDNFNNKFDYKFIQIVKNFESKPEGYSSNQKIAISNKKKLINESSLPFNKKVELKEYVNYLTQSKSFNIDDFDKEFNVNFNQVIKDYDKLIKSKSKINYNENSNLKNYQKNDIEELKYIPIDSKTITCNKCGKKLKKTHFFSKNGKYSSICKKCYEKKFAAKYLEDILEYLSPNQKFDESIFLKNHPDFNAEMINTLKEQNLIDINLETNETSLTSNVVIENFFKEQNQSTYKSNINNSDNIDIKQINEKLDDIIRENLEIKKSLKEKDLEIKKLKDLIPNE